MGKSLSEASELLGRVRVATPCPTSWEAMEGDDRVRFCGLCQLNVYNLSEMTRDEAASLVARTEGRLCARLYRRADGTLITKDCPVGLAAVRRRVRRAAAAVFAALTSFWAVAAGQQTPAPGGGQGQQPAVLACEGGGQLKIRRKPAAAGEEPKLSGVALDPNGAAVPGATAKLTNELTKEEAQAVTGADGSFSFTLKAAGAYTLQLEGPGFATQRIEGVKVEAGESLTAELTLGLSTVYVTVGILSTYYPHEVNNNGKTVVDGKDVRRLPL